MPTFMFDTMIFNKILDNQIDINNFSNSNKYYITHIQLDEIKNTRNKKRRKDLLKVLFGIPSEPTPTESFVLGISRLGMAKLGNGGIYALLLNELEKNKPQDKNNKKDALIGETSINNSLILVTDEKALEETIRNCGGQSISFRQFKEDNGIS